ncbi:hypothetical protein HHI36_014451 [Cryptolaemus montrouzieri]|uniref:Uncharacterized protein n=1 Tax=Cryptolaemus montrouzieri TaxID=559131 RepID=A0ABD2N2W2_9CUCU
MNLRKSGGVKAKEKRDRQRSGGPEKDEEKLPQDNIDLDNPDTLTKMNTSLKNQLEELAEKTDRRNCTPERYKKSMQTIIEKMEAENNMLGEKLTLKMKEKKQEIKEEVQHPALHKIEGRICSPRERD